MSSTNLISSLFRDNSFAARSSSLFQKPIAGHGDHESRARSQSGFRDRAASTDPNCRYLPVVRLVHLLAVKVKKHNYFLFCRLEAQMKKSRA